MNTTGSNVEVVPAPLDSLMKGKESGEHSPTTIILEAKKYPLLRGKSPTGNV